MLTWEVSLASKGAEWTDGKNTVHAKTNVTPTNNACMVIVVCRGRRMDMDRRESVLHLYLVVSDIITVEIRRSFIPHTLDDHCSSTDVLSLSTSDFIHQSFLSSSFADGGKQRIDEYLSVIVSDRFVPGLKFVRVRFNLLGREMPRLKGASSQYFD